MQTGIVEAVSTKDVTTKFGTKPTYSIKVNGGWVKCGFKNHNANVGDEVEFDGNTGTYGLETKAVVVLRRGTSAPAVTSSTPAVGVVAPQVPQVKSFSGYKDKVFPIPALHGDRAIVRQNALARATDIYIAARGGKPFELEPENLDFVIKLARKFEAYTAGDIDMMEAIEEDSENPLV
jgi:hypothetical protein